MMSFLGRWSVLLFAAGLGGVMSIQDDLRAARIIAFTTLTIMLVVFVVAYAFGSPWRATTEGKVLLAYMTSLMVICLQSTVTVILGADYPGRELISAITLYGVAVTAAGFTWMLIRQQYRQRAEVWRLQRERDALQRELDGQQEGERE